MATLTTTGSAGGWAPSVQGFVPTEVVPTALLIQATTKAGQIEGDGPTVVVPWVRDDTASWVPEGATIPDAPNNLAETVIKTGKVATLLRVSREQWMQEQAAGLLSTAASKAIQRAADAALLNAYADPDTLPDDAKGPAGILDGPSGITEGGTVDDTLDALVDLIAEIEAAGGTPSHIVMHPSAWAALRRIKVAADRADSLLGAGVIDTPRMLLDVPVLTSPMMTEGAGLVIDKSAIASAYGEVQVATSEDAFFAADAIGLRVTWRIGWRVMRPERLGLFTVDTTTP
jgi:HK97 family phage major capsid protein